MPCPPAPASPPSAPAPVAGVEAPPVVLEPPQTTASRGVVWRSEEVLYVGSVSLAEHTFTHMLRNSGEVLAEVEQRDVVLRRRDGEDLFLGLRSREESVRDALGVLARILLAASIDPETRWRVVGALGASLPWTTFLPDDERAEFFEALTATAAACVEVDMFEPLARLIEGWRATAEIHANPEVAEFLGVPRSGPAVTLERPKVS